jgi:Family of unknown function (DUF6804)
MKNLEVAMPTKMMKWISIAALLLLSVLSWNSTSDYRTVLAALAVCAGAVVVLVQSGSRGKYTWAAVFLAIGVLFNPVVPIALPRTWFVVLDLLCMVLFVWSLAALRTQTRLSIASITDRTPGSESL